MATATILIFKSQNFICWMSLEGQGRSPCHILSKFIEFCQNGSIHCKHIVIFWLLKKADITILYFQIWRSGGLSHITVPKFCQNRSILRYHDFSILWIVTGYHLEVLKLQNFVFAGVRGAEARHSAKFRQNRSIRCRYRPTAIFSKWPPPPSWILEIIQFYWLTGSGW